MDTQPLLDILTGPLAYDYSIAIYARRIKGAFREDSPAFVAARTSNIGMNGYSYFASNGNILEFYKDFLKRRKLENFNEHSLGRAARDLIKRRNDLDRS
jgi:hypothetical protein